MTRKLWQSGSATLDPVVERFLAADDIQWDQRLVPYDILGNAAQARVLVRAKVLTKAEGRRLVSALAALYRQWERGGLKLRLSDEDVHTRIEAELTKRLGALGKKIHTGRSRNDQVLFDLNLYLSHRVLDLQQAPLTLALACLKVAKRYGRAPMPGYTHMQRAMPSTVALWMDAWRWSFFGDSFEMEWPQANLLSCPLGSASGYGSLVSTDTNYLASLIYYANPLPNTLHVQTRRGKVEFSIMHGIAQTLLDCNRLATDGLLFSTAEFGFVKLPASLTTGSSLMPNKRNADVWELVRAAYHAHLGDLTALASVQANLPSGYNRDLQITKGIVIRSIERALEVMEVMRRTVEGMEIDVKRCRKACDDSILATDRATLLALSGTPFREAYRAVKEGGAAPDLTLEEALQRKEGLGSPGYSGLLLNGNQCSSFLGRVRSLQGKRMRRLARLLNPAWRMGT